MAGGCRHVYVGQAVSANGHQSETAGLLKQLFGQKIGLDRQNREALGLNPARQFFRVRQLPGIGPAFVGYRHQLF